VADNVAREREREREKERAGGREKLTVTCARELERREKQRNARLSKYNGKREKL